MEHMLQNRDAEFIKLLTKYNITAVVKVSKLKYSLTNVQRDVDSEEVQRRISKVRDMQRNITSEELKTFVHVDIPDHMRTGNYVEEHVAEYWESQEAHLTEDFMEFDDRIPIWEFFNVFEEVGELPCSLDKRMLLTAENVDLSGCVELSLPQVRRLAEVLARNISLTSITLRKDHMLPVGDLRNNEDIDWSNENYTDTDAIFISQLLRTNTTVKSLNLTNNLIEDAGAYALAELLTKNNTMETLTLESNMLGEKAGRAFSVVLSLNNTLQRLNLKGNSIPLTIMQAIHTAWVASRGSPFGLSLK